MTIERVVLRCSKDNQDRLIADNIIRVGSEVNIFDLEMSGDKPTTSVDWTATIADGGYVESILVRICGMLSTGYVVEHFVLTTTGFGTRFSAPQGSLGQKKTEPDTGDRAIHLSTTFDMAENPMTADGTPSNIFLTCEPWRINLELMFTADLNIRKGIAQAEGAAHFKLPNGLFDKSSPGMLKFMNSLTVEVLGWTPHLYFDDGR